MGLSNCAFGCCSHGSQTSHPKNLFGADGKFASVSSLAHVALSPASGQCCHLQSPKTTWHAGRAAEELIYGQDEMSTINQRRLVMARRIVQKLTVSSAMVDNIDIGPRTISSPTSGGGRALLQIVTDRVSWHAVVLSSLPWIAERLLLSHACAEMVSVNSEGRCCLILLCSE